MTYSMDLAELGKNFGVDLSTFSMDEEGWSTEEDPPTT
jgi:hypothetical protein